MPISDIVVVNITTESASARQPGFGVPLILGFHTVFAEVVRTYTTLAGMVSDGFTSSMPEYLAAQSLLSQNPQVTSFMVGRRALRPTLSWDLTPTAKNSHIYTFKLNGAPVTFTSDSSSTVAEACTGIDSAVDALSISGLTSTDGTTKVTLAMTIGTWLRIDSELAALPGDIKFEAVHADPGIATDLAAIALASDAWYAFHLTSQGKAEVKAAAAWAEANSRLYVQQTIDSETINTAAGSQTGLSHDLKTSAYARTGTIYHPDNGEFGDAGWLGKNLPYNPGAATWKFKTLNGVSSYSLTPTQQTNAEGVRVNTYTSVAGVPITQQGVTASGEYLDVIRDRDWFKSRLEVRIFNLLANQPKVPFTDAGIAAVEAEVRGAIQEGIKAGFLAPTGWSVIVPRAKDVSGTDKAARALTGVSFVAVLAGAIHAVTISGVISL